MLWLVSLADRKAFDHFSRDNIEKDENHEPHKSAVLDNPQIWVYLFERDSHRAYQFLEWLSADELLIFMANAYEKNIKIVSLIAVHALQFIEDAKTYRVEQLWSSNFRDRFFKDDDYYHYRANTLYNIRWSSRYGLEGGWLSAIIECEQAVSKKLVLFVNQKIIPAVKQFSCHFERVEFPKSFFKKPHPVFILGVHTHVDALKIIHFDMVKNVLALLGSETVEYEMTAGEPSVFAQYVKSLPWTRFELDEAFSRMQMNERVYLHWQGTLQSATLDQLRARSPYLYARYLRKPFEKDAKEAVFGETVSLTELRFSVGKLIYHAVIRDLINNPSKFITLLDADFAILYDYLDTWTDANLIELYKNAQNANIRIFIPVVLRLLREENHTKLLKKLIETLPDEVLAQEISENDNGLFAALQETKHFNTIVTLIKKLLIKHSAQAVRALSLMQPSSDNNEIIALMSYVKTLPVDLSPLAQDEKSTLIRDHINRNDSASFMLLFAKLNQSAKIRLLRSLNVEHWRILAKSDNHATDCLTVMLSDEPDQTVPNERYIEIMSVLCQSGAFSAAQTLYLFMRAFLEDTQNNDETRKRLLSAFYHLLEQQDFTDHQKVCDETLRFRRDAFLNDIELFVREVSQQPAIALKYLSRFSDHDFSILNKNIFLDSRTVEIVLCYLGGHTPQHIINEIIATEYLIFSFKDLKGHKLYAGYLFSELLTTDRGLTLIQSIAIKLTDEMQLYTITPKFVTAWISKISPQISTDFILWALGFVANIDAREPNMQDRTNSFFEAIFVKLYSGLPETHDKLIRFVPTITLKTIERFERNILEKLINHKHDETAKAIYLLDPCFFNDPIRRANYADTLRQMTALSLITPYTMPAPPPYSPSAPPALPATSWLSTPQMQSDTEEMILFTGRASRKTVTQLEDEVAALKGELAALRKSKMLTARH